MQCCKPIAVAPMCVTLLVTPAGRALAQDSAAMSKTRVKVASEDYEPSKIEGWTVLVNREFLRRRSTLAEQTLTLLRHQLYQIVRRLPKAAVTKLRRTRIWVEEDEPNTTCMAYHPNAAWLVEHGVNPAKHKCIEVANARNFLKWTLDQPWMVLHEMSHAYHHQFLRDGFHNARVKAAYDKAMRSKIYAKVLRIDGREERAYATKNPMEYFAEASEAFFGTNDFYPFVRPELQRHDPAAYELLVDQWGIGLSEPIKTTPRRPAGKPARAKGPRG